MFYIKYMFHIKCKNIYTDIKNATNEKIKNIYIGNKY